MATEEVATKNKAESEDQDEERGTVKGLVGLVAELEGYDMTTSDPLAMPGFDKVAEAICYELRRIEMRLAAGREALDAMGFDFDWQDGDLAVERDAGLDALDAVGDLTEGLRVSLLSWLGTFNNSRTVELDRAAMEAVQELAGLMGGRRGQHAKRIVDAAVRHLAASPDGTAIIAKAERERSLRYERELRELGVKKHPNDRDSWPWTKADGKPWHPDKGQDVGGEQRTCDTGEVPDIGETGESPANGGAAGDVPALRPLSLWLSSDDLNEAHEDVRFVALDGDLAALRCAVRKLAAQYSSRYSAALARAAAGGDNDQD